MKKKTLFIILGILVAVLILGSMTNLTDKLKGDKDDDDTTAAVTTTEAAVTVPTTGVVIGNDANGNPIVYSPVAEFDVPSLGADHKVNSINFDELTDLHTYKNAASEYFYLFEFL